MNAPDPTSAEPLRQRGLRIAALGIETLLITFLLLLGLAAAPTPLRGQLHQLLGLSEFGAQAAPSGAVYGWGAIALLLAIGVFLGSWRLQRRSWYRIAFGYAVVAGVFAYLVHDDPTIRRPLTLEQVSPGFPGAERSFGVMMRYGKAHPLGLNFKAPTFKDPFPTLVPEPSGRWRATVTSRRAEFESNWIELAPVRAWLTELEALGPIADLTPAHADAEIIAFQPLRSLSQHGIAIASLQALDGHGDEAIDTLLPILQLGRGLQPSSRTLVRAMIGVVIERLSLETANFILDNAAVSPAARARLAAALLGGDPEAGARHLLAIEYAFQLGAFGGARAGDILAEWGPRANHPWLRRTLNALSPFIYNPHATFNLYGDLYSDLQDLAGRRQLEQMGPRMKKFIDLDARPSFKNAFGKSLAQLTVPAYLKVTENYWRAQDQRAALVARLSKQ
ncbi:MAG: hypothetical protein WAK51_05855 [Opitutaceae bacterium]